MYYQKFRKDDEKIQLFNLEKHSHFQKKKNLNGSLLDILSKKCEASLCNTIILKDYNYKKIERLNKMVAWLSQSIPPCPFLDWYYFFHPISIFSFGILCHYQNPKRKNTHTCTRPEVINFTICLQRSQNLI